jgi:hypothetical protein
MMNRIALLSTALLAAGTLLCSPVFAQTLEPGHPGLNEVNERLQHQETAIGDLETQGKLTTTQATQDLLNDQNMQTKVNTESANNGGRITVGELVQMNKAEDSNLNLMDKQDGSTIAPGSGTYQPMIKEVDQRMQNQQALIAQLETNGKLSSTQAQQDLANVTKVNTNMTADIAKTGGTITPNQLGKLNVEENRNLHLIAHQSRH